LLPWKNCFADLGGTTLADLTIALGGGGVKGLAHIGVLKVLEKEGFNIRALAGTSAGGIVGSLYAAGYSIPEIEKIGDRLKLPHFFSRTPFDGPSLLGVKGGTQALTEYLGDRRFEDLPILFACTAVDLNSSEEIILAHGNVVEAILATIAIPGVFPPRLIDHYQLVDGGVLDPVPVALARWLSPSSTVIAVCLTPAPETWAQLPDPHFLPSTPIPRPILDTFARLRISQAVQIFYKSFDVTGRMLSELRMQIDKPDVIIRPDVGKYAILDNVNTKEVVAVGEAAAEMALPEIRQALSWSNRLTHYFRRSQVPGKVIESGSPNHRPLDDE
jgi:NTE family protein